ncbi:MAG: hypothetical protein Q9191_003193 [Dirinaria sp. TL-2023a]
MKLHLPTIFFLSACSALTTPVSNLAATSASASLPSSGTTITILPTQLVLPSTTLTRAAPAATLNGTQVSFGLSALVLGTRTIPYPAPGPAVPVLTIASQATFAAGPGGIILGDTGTTISNNGPDATVGGTEVSLGSQGLVVGGTSTLSIPTVQPLSSVFTVGGTLVTEEFGQIVFPAATGAQNASGAGASTGAAATRSATAAQPFLGGAERVSGRHGVMLGIAGLAVGFMKHHARMLRFVVVLAIGVTLLPSIVAQNSTVISLDQTPNNTLEATAFALIYALPLIQLVNQTTAVFQAVNGTNKINNQDQLASLSSAAVVKPNVDTLYSRVIVDLSQNDLELNIPVINDRFWIFPFYDTFGNNYANLSPINNSQPGLYLIRRASDALAAPGVQLLNSDAAKAYYPKYTGIINAPTTHGTGLFRLLLKFNTTDNLNIVHRLQNATTLTPVPRAIAQPNTPASPQWTPAFFNQSFTGTPPEQLLQLLARVAPYNQPLAASERFRVASILGDAGIVGGNYSRPSSVNITQAYAIANATISRDIADNSTINFLANGWQLPRPDYAGNFGTHYSHRAYIARTGYQQLLTSIVLYPGLNGPAFGPFSIAGNKSFLYTWSGKPPVNTALNGQPDVGGFWSLTFYGEDQYLIPNALGRFSVGDRPTGQGPNGGVELTYPDGAPIYGPNSSSTRDGPFKLLVQPANVVPPANWTSNWLPVPSGGGSGSFILRFYAPSDALSNGQYVYPKVETIDSIRA